MAKRKRRSPALSVPPATASYPPHPPGFGVMRVCEDIVPFGEFKAKASAVFRRLRTERRPVVVTQHGRPAGVVIPPDEWDRIQYEEGIRRAVRDGLADLEAGRVYSHGQVMAEMRAMIARMGKKA